MDGPSAHPERRRCDPPTCCWWSLPDNRVLIRYPWTNGSVVYLPIPKCGTTSMFSWIKPAGWEKRTTLPDLPAFAIVRDPVDRWFSGVNEYAVNQRKDYQGLLDEARAGRMVFDQHTRPQAAFLDDYCRD